MVICKYYLEGRCQFGSNCRYDHIDTYEKHSQVPNVRSSYTRPTSSINRPSLASPLTSINVVPQASYDRRGSAPNYDPSRFRWTASTSVNPPAPVHQQRRSSNAEAAAARRERKSSDGPITDEESLLKRIQGHMETWRESAQWPFSCYGLRNFESMFGFIDSSPEEMRLRAYEHRAAGKMKDYENEAKNLMNAKRVQWTHLMHLSAADREQMLRTLKPYVVRASSPTDLATKNSAIGTSQGTKPLFSASTENRAPTQASKSLETFSFNPQRGQQPSTSKMENPAPQAAKPMDPSNFSFKTTSPGSALLNIVNETAKQTQVNPVYTEKVVLTSEELKAFEASEFLSFDEIPVRPPPKELC